MKDIPVVLAVILVCGCHTRPSANHTTALDTLTGVVIRKDWAKSMESWNAGGSEYYVLKIEDPALTSNKRTAREGVILHPSKAIPFQHFTNFVGQTVTCQGEFVTGKPYIPPKDSVEQMPSPTQNPFTGEMEYPIRGGGFKVYAIDPVTKRSEKITEQAHDPTR